MTLTRAEHRIVKGIECNVADLVNVIKGDLKKPDEPGMAETLRSVQVKVDTFVEDHTATHKGIRRLLAGIGIMALVALLLHWETAAALVMGLVELAVKLVT
jgi:hypothetical protein